MFRTLFSLVVAAALGFSAVAQNKELTVELQGGLKSKAVRIAGSPELVALAQMAFKTHGDFRVVPSGGMYALTFTAAGANQVRLEVTAGNPARTVLSQVVNGASNRNALFRAADVAVQQITGLPGYFAGRITFISERTGRSEVWASDLFFGEALQITHDKAFALMPRWSPDGSSIVYTSYFNSGSPEIFVMTPATGQRRTFANFKGTNSGGRFSPDGSRVAAVLSAAGNQEIFIGTPQGKPFRRLTKSPGIEASPSWSPDGSRLVFTSDRGGRPALYTMSVAGGAMTPLPTNISGYCAEPDWNRAQPNLIAFTCAVRSGFQIAVYDLNARRSEILTKGGDSIEPCWLADGRHLIFTRRAANSRQLAILDTETGKVTPLNQPALGQVSQANYLKR